MVAMSGSAVREIVIIALPDTNATLEFSEALTLLFACRAEMQLMDVS
jgi:hypothetical protein